MKKLISLVIVTALILSFSVIAFGEEAPALTIELEENIEGTLTPGDKITVLLGIKNNPGILAIGAILEYDETVFKLEDSGIENGKGFSDFYYGEIKSGMKLNWIANILGGDVSKDLTLATLTFTVIGDEGGKAKINFLFDPEIGSFNYDEEDIIWKDAETLILNTEKGGAPTGNQNEENFESNESENMIHVENPPRVEEKSNSKTVVVAIAGILLLIGAGGFVIYKKKK